MPLYEFFCSTCRKKTEELCTSTVNRVSCPSCGGSADKVFSTFRTGRSASGNGSASSGCGG